MRPYACLVFVLFGSSGCISIEPGPEPGYAPGSFNGGVRRPVIPGVQGPHGEAVPMVAPYAHRPPANAAQAHYMMSQHQALTDVQINSPNMAMPSGMTAPGAMPPQVPMPGGMLLSPPGVPFMPGAPGNTMAPFPQPGGPGNMMPPFPPPGGGMMQAKGFGMDSGLMQAKFSPEAPTSDSGVTQAAYPPGVVAAMGAIPPSDGVRFSVQRTQVRFLRPSGMKIAWFTRGANGQPMYSSNPIEAPGRYNFQQGAVYRLKISNIEGRPGLEVYPTLEVVPVNVKTEAFLAHSAVPIDFTDEDFNQIAQGNFVVKVIYLPDSEYQEFAGAGVDQILSTQLEPGADPIKEALRRGSILLVVRMGNVDQEAPNTPGLGTGSNQGGMAGSGSYGPCPPPMVPYILPPGMMPPPGMPPPGMFMPPAQNGAVGGQQDQNGNGPMSALPGSNVPNLVPPPSNAMVRPLDQMPNGPTLPPFGDVPAVPKETPGTLTGRSAMPTPEMGPAPTQLPVESPETALPPTTPMGNARPEPKVPDELLHSMPPTQDPGTAPSPSGVQNPTKFTPAPDEGLPPAGVTAPIPPSALDQGGPPAMLPPTDPGQGEELQRIGGVTRPTNMNMSGRRAFP